jgi:hypothetical protein
MEKNPTKNNLTNGSQLISHSNGIILFAYGGNWLDENYQS